MIGLSSDVEKFLNQVDVSSKTLLMITSGGADWQPEPELHIDAFTSASRKENISGLVQLILDWIDRDPATKWEPDDYLRIERIQSAVEVFKLNAHLYPDSWNVYDSYGEALFLSGKIDDAVNNYQKALELNPDSKSSKGMLLKLGNY
jgi:tetratricopeptide (TPR) repeat protein